MRVPSRHRARRYLLALTLACAALLCTAPAAFAVGLTVDSLADTEGGGCSPTTGCTLREAIYLVAEGEDEPDEGIGGDVTIDFADDVEGTIEIEDEYELIFGEGVESLTIVGPGRSVVKINGKETTRIFRTYEGEVKISGLTLENGHVGGFALDGDGGAGLFVNGGDITVEDVRFTANTIDGERGGAAIDVEEGNLTVVDSLIDHNSTDANVEGSGGGINIDSSGSTVTVVDTEITDNTTDVGQGGGIYQDEGNLLVEGSLIAGNKVGTGNAGGGIGAEQDGSHTTLIVDSTIEGNNAADFGYGGGVWSKPGSGGVTIENSTVAGNSAMVGGGIAVVGPTTIDTTTIAGNDGDGVNVAADTTIHASTIVGNETPFSGGGGINQQLEAATVRSTIVAGNKNESGASDCAGEITSLGNNILGTESSECTWSPAPEDQLGVDPELGELANNGGPTMTVAPISASSPAINRGTDPNFEDQRGRTRPVPEGNPTDTDVGAVEVQAPINETAPAVTYEGDLAAGTELTCDAGEWDTDTVTEFEPSYAWLVEEVPVAATQTYTPDSEDAESEIVCVETVDNGPTSKAVESEPVEFGLGALSISPDSYDFGVQNIGTGSPSQQFTVTNAGAAAVTVTKAESSDETQFPVSGDECTGEVLAPGDECTVEATFAPTAGGGQNAGLAVLSDAPTISAELSGTGNQPVLSVSPGSHDFGSRRVDSGPGAPQSFEVTNESEGPVATGLVDIGVDGPAEVQFATTADGDECSGTTLEAGESCSVEVVFEPTEAGVAGANLEIPSEGPTVSAALSGSGTIGAVTVSPTSFDFGSRAIASGPSAPQVFEVTSTGSEAVTIGTLSASGEFELPAVGNLCDGMTLQPTEKCTVEVVFDPIATGAKSGTLSVPSDVPTATASLAGTGVFDPAFAADPAELAFGSHEIGTTAVETVTISNLGGAPASIDAVEVSGTGAAAFSLPESGDECSGAELLPAESCSVEVAFSPSASGSAGAILEVAGGAPTLSVPLNGTGVEKPTPPPPPAPTPPSASLLSSGPFTGSGSGAVPLTLACTSPGGAACQVSVALSAGGAGLGSWSGTLAPGSSGAAEVALSAGARKQLGAKGRLAAEAVIGVAGGNTTTVPVTLLAPPAPKLAVKSAKRSGNAIVFKLSCQGYASRCQGKLTLGPAKGSGVYASGKIALAKGNHEVRLPLTGAGKRALEAEPRIQLEAKASAKDAVYGRTTTATEKLRLGA